MDVLDEFEVPDEVNYSHQEIIPMHFRKKYDFVLDYPNAFSKKI